MSKEQLEASLETFEVLFQIFTVFLAIATAGAADFGVKACCLSPVIPSSLRCFDVKLATYAVKRKLGFSELDVKLLLRAIGVYRRVFAQ